METLSICTHCGVDITCPNCEKQHYTQDTRKEFTKEDMIDFHEWIRLAKPSELKHVGNVSGYSYSYKGELYTTGGLLHIYLKTK